MRCDFEEKYAVVASGGDVWLDDSTRRILEGASFVVAADSGAHFLHKLGITPDVVLGDLDSCDISVVEDLRSKGARIIVLKRDKDKTDTEASLDLVLAQGYRQAVVVGALGGERLEHSIANVLLIEHFAAQGLDVVLSHNDTLFLGIGGVCGRKQRRFYGKAGDWVSLFAITETASGVTTSGLRFSLSNATLVRGSTFGTSNEMVGDQAEVSLVQGFVVAVVTGRDELLR